MTATKILPLPLAVCLLASCGEARAPDPRPPAEPPPAQPRHALEDVQLDAVVAGVVERAHRSAGVWGGEVFLLRLGRSEAAPRVAVTASVEALREGQRVALSGTLRPLRHYEGPIFAGASIGDEADDGLPLPVAMALDDPAPTEPSAGAIDDVAGLVAALQPHALRLAGRLERDGARLFLRLEDGETCLPVLVVAEATDAFDARVGERVELRGSLRPQAEEGAAADGCLPVHGLALAQPTLR